MIDKKTFKQTFATPFENSGFVKKGQSWYLRSKDTIIVVNLQKSDWDDSYYINIGIWFRALGDELYPDENRCQISFRVEKLFPEMREKILISCSLKNSNSALLVELTTFIESQLLPLLQEFTDLKKLRELISTKTLKGGLITLDAKMFLFGSDGVL